MELKHKKVIVAGSGISGLGAAKLLYELEAEVILYDNNIALREEHIREKLPDEMEVKITLGVLKTEILDDVSLCVISPGIPMDVPFILEIQKKGIPVIGELELAFCFAKGKLAAITGTNGKTTTTALVGEIFENHYKSAFVVGNIGIPYTESALKTREESVTVAEVSSFQLETIETFKPYVAAILNISPDHLDRHGTLEDYIEVKCSMLKNQTKEDYVILNYDDQVLRKVGENVTAQVMYFSRKKRLEYGVYLDGNEIFYHDGKKEALVCRTGDLVLLGAHNHENVMAAIAIGILMEVPLEIIRETVKRFKAVEHRIEFVMEKGGVAYYNDSKGTNPDAAIKGITAMEKPTYLIAGGYDKDSEFGEWVRAFKDKVKYIVLIGQTRDKIAAAAREQGFTDIIYAEDLEEAVKVCYAYASSGDAVLLSPACASWGMFENYEQRGNLFKEYVNNL